MTIASFTLLILRLVVGLTFAAHGAQKAFGWWNGPGLEKWREIVAGMRFRPVGLWTAVSVGAELVGGLMLALGLLTPLAATALIGQSVVLTLKVHLRNGFWNANHGVEFGVALGTGALALLGVGPGSLSIDHAIGFALSEPVLWLLLVIGLVGGVASYGVSQLAGAPRAAAMQHR
jgi:putative oxidoreductase